MKIRWRRVIEGHDGDGDVDSQSGKSKGISSSCEGTYLTIDPFRGAPSLYISILFLWQGEEVPATVIHPYSCTAVNILLVLAEVNFSFTSICHRVFEDVT